MSRSEETVWSASCHRLTTASTSSFSQSHARAVKPNRRASRILVDLDSTVANLLPSWLSLYNDKYKDHLAIEDLKTFDISSIVRPECGERIFQLLDHPGLFRDIPPYRKAIEVLHEWHRTGHEITIVTAANPETPGMISDKWAWVRRYLPFVDLEHFVLCSGKHVVCGEVFLDDSPDQISRYRERWPEAFIGGIAFPYNSKVENMMNCRAIDYRDPERAWGQIKQAVDAYLACAGWGNGI